MDNAMGHNGGAPRIIELDTQDPIAFKVVWACCVVGALIVLLLAEGAVVPPPLDAGVEGMVYLGYPDRIAAWLGPAQSPAPPVG